MDPALLEADRWRFWWLLWPSILYSLGIFSSAGGTNCRFTHRGSTASDESACAGVDIKFSGGQPGGWSDGPTLSLREGDLESVALRALQAPVLPPLHPGRPTEVGLSPWRDRGGWN
jgi:hypothetical protein